VYFILKIIHVKYFNPAKANYLKTAYLIFQKQLKLLSSNRSNALKMGKRQASAIKKYFSAEVLPF